MGTAEREEKLSPGEMNLTKRISTCGKASRRKAADLIQSGHVTVNGATETNPAVTVGPSDRVCVDGSPCDNVPEKVYIMLNKPRGYVCTCSDPHAKKKALDLIRLRNQSLRLFSVGRLDKDSEGLILFTNDGFFADRIEHPRNGIVKTYAVSLDHPFTEEQLQKMCDGVECDGEHLAAVEVWPSGPRKIMVSLQEGKKREVRRLVTALDNDTKRLERVAIGELRKGMLKCGEWRFLNRRDIAKIFHLPQDSPELDAYPVRKETPRQAQHGEKKDFRKNNFRKGNPKKGTDYGRQQESPRSGRHHPGTLQDRTSGRVHH